MKLAIIVGLDDEVDLDTVKVFEQSDVDGIKAYVDLITPSHSVILRKNIDTALMTVRYDPILQVFHLKDK